MNEYNKKYVIEIKKSRISYTFVWAVLLTAFSLVCLFIPIGIIAEPNRKPGGTPDKVTTNPPPSEDDEDSEEVKEAKFLFDKLIVSHAKVNGRAVARRAAVIHGGLVNILLKEPKLFATISDDQFKEISRFIAVAYGRVMSGYILEGIEKKKENQLEVTFWYDNISDKYLPMTPNHLAESMYTYTKEVKGEGVVVVDEKLKPPSKCVAEHKQYNAVMAAMNKAIERFRYKILNEYRLYDMPMFEQVTFKRVLKEYSPNRIEFILYRPYVFRTLPKSRIFKIFERLANDHYEAFRFYYRYCFDTFLKEEEKVFVFFDLWNEETKRWVSQLEGHLHASDVFWYQGGYDITKDGPTTVTCEYKNRDYEWELIK
jgi:hypothetical protein